MGSRNRTFRPARYLLGCSILLFILTILPAWGAAESLDLDQDLQLPSAWVKTFDTRLWSGYKDNVLLGAQNPVDSSFLAGGLDMTFFRLPIDNWEYLFLSSLEYLHYFSAPEVDQEVIALAQAQAKRTFGEHWKAGLSAEYVYFNQVFDASTTEDDLFAVQVEGHGFTLRPGLTRDLPRNFRLDLELPATRQLFAEFIDDHWEFGPKLVFGHETPRKRALSLGYQFSNRIHDSREARDDEGVLRAGRGLQFHQHEISAVWRQFWGAERRWRTVSKASVQRNEDNGGGYYNFWRPQFSQQIRYQAPAWEVRAETRLSYYRYDQQHVDELDSAIREKAYLRTSIRAEKLLVKTWKLFAQYEHERAISNLDLDEYQVNMVSGGMSYEF